MSDKPLIIHYIHDFGIGGAQSILLELFYAINKYSEYKQIVITKKISSQRAAINAKSYGVEVVELKNKKFHKFILSKKPCMLVYHKLFRSDTSIYEKLYSKVPIVVVNHTYTTDKVWSKIKRCNYIVAVCQSMLNAIAKNRSVCKGGMKMILNGVNADRYYDIKAIKRQERSALITGRINRFGKWKYSNGWIKWCLRLELPKRMIHEYIGSGPLFKKAKKCLDKHKYKYRRNHVFLKGSISSMEEKISILKSWDVFLYETNEQEGLSVSILEALSCGIPVVCSNHFGNKEIIEDGVNGYVFKSRDHAKEILSSLCDSTNLENLKRTTKKHYKDNKLDARYMAEKYIKLLESIKIKNG